MITVRFFAAAREAVGADSESMAFAGPVAEFRRALADRWPSLSCLLPRCAVAVNRTYACDDSAIAPGDEVALLPPVSGG
jgi:molybdopterin converting factor subunit 1